MSSFVVVFAVAASIALAALAMLSREAGEPAILLILAALAATGVFFLFAVSAGFFRLDVARPVAPLLNAYADQLADGIEIRTAEGRPIYANQAFARLLGLSGTERERGVEEVLAETTGAAEALFRLMRAAERGYEWEEVVLLPATEALPHGAALRVAVSHIQPHGGERHVVWRVSDAAAAEAAPVPVAGTATNALAVFDDLPAGVFTLQGGEVVHVNAVLADLAGRDRHEALPRGAGLAAIGLEPRPERSAPATRGMRQGDTGSVPHDLIRRDGSKIAVRVLERRMADSGDVTIGVVIPDPGDRPASVAAVDAEPVEKLFARFFHAAPIAIAIVEPDGAIGNSNAAYGRMFLGRSEQMRGGNIIDIVKPESRESVKQALAALFAGGQAMLPIEIVFGAADGRQTGRLYLSPLGNRAGDRDAAVLYAIDTTKERELELQFAQSQKMQAVGQLAGGIAHDFNNVLTVIIGFSDLLLANHRPTDPAFRDIMAIKQNANRAASLVRQLLAFSRRQTLRPEVLSLSDVISDLSIFLSRILGEKVKLKVSHGRDLWEVKADVTQFEQVIINLAVNARDAMPEGGKLTIRTSNLPAADSARLKDEGVDPGDYVVCEVADNGTGMTREVMEKMFEPFFSTKEVGKGTGLGLSTVYGIVKQTGGYVFCDSTLGKGTTFRIYLPRHVEHAGATQVVAKVEKKERPKDLTGTGTVLLVEDEEAVRRFAARALTRQGYNVLEAGSGAEALEVFAGHDGTIDLVLSDVVMPEMDGPTLLKELRKSHADLKIIFISGYAEEALKSLQGDEEFAFLPKPFQLKELVAAVKDAVER